MPKFISPEDFYKKYCGDAAAQYFLEKVFKPYAKERAASGATEFFIYAKPVDGTQVDVEKRATELLAEAGWGIEHRRGAYVDSSGAAAEIEQVVASIPKVPKEVVVASEKLYISGQDALAFLATFNIRPAYIGMGVLNDPNSANQDFDSLDIVERIREVLTRRIEVKSRSWTAHGLSQVPQVRDVGGK